MFILCTQQIEQMCGLNSSSEGLTSPASLHLLMWDWTVTI